MDVLILLDIFADHHHTLHAFCNELPADLRHAEAAVHWLAAGHGHGVVVENLVGDLHLGRDGSPNRENAGVEIGSVTEVGEHMLSSGKRCLADPRHAFAPHLTERLGLRVDPGGHVMAADAGQCATALRDFGRGVVRATGTVVGHAFHQVTELVFARQLRIQHRQAHLQRATLMQAQNAFGQRPGDHSRGQVVDGG
ncbi:hypothetical protein D3C86_1399220 [compost metagenome]